MSGGGGRGSAHIQLAPTARSNTLRVEIDATLWSVYDSWQTISLLIQNLTSEGSRRHTCAEASAALST